MRELEPQSVERMTANGHEPDDSFEDDDEPGLLDKFTRRRMAGALSLVLVVLLALVIPPLVNMGRYRRQIATSISRSLGRPVHIDNVTLNILPLPGFTLDNFVVDEDPAFGSEPVIRADQVRVTLRVSSLWRHRVEFSRISLDGPSVNLVHLPDGRWNLQSILLQASRMPAAPTAQTGAGPAQRFPYIEATNGRVNLKLGLEKTPISLTEADFALWLPEPESWHLRLEAHPARTDTAATGTGVLRAEGTLGHAPTLAAVPIDLKLSWTAAPLGAVSRIVTGKDAGFRGNMTLRAGVEGTMGDNRLETSLELTELRRADFVPERMMSADIDCRAVAAQVFHALKHVRCRWPSESPGAGLTVTGEIPELFAPGSAELRGELKDVPAGLFLDGLRMVSSRISPELQLGGTVDGTARVSSGQVDAAGEIDHVSLGLRHQPSFVDVPPQITFSMAEGELGLSEIPLALGGKDPAALEISATRAGYRMHLTGSVLRARLMALAAALPPLGDGLEAALPSPLAGAAGPVRVDLVSTRGWRGGQSWMAAPVVREKRSRRR